MYYTISNSIDEPKIGFNNSNYIVVKWSLNSCFVDSTIMEARLFTLYGKIELTNVGSSWSSGRRNDSLASWISGLSIEVNGNAERHITKLYIRAKTLPSILSITRKIWWISKQWSPLVFFRHVLINSLKAREGYLVLKVNVACLNKLSIKNKDGEVWFNVIHSPLIER